ncbi:isoleucine--tRNA ligase [Paludibacter sp.]|uniref:isoleucine--tRNA ligase n=1 Tax=Paludibacter sp. TaxID=1898105 RepID=UPI0013549B00|nr:isoleucine--tRNA ligase [Paludibacter sp.]MTK51859.1 isoleucine--tRNA ligase [Paludibacter sp.]
MSKKFAEYSSFNLSDINKEVLKKWDEQDIFHKSLETRKGHPSFIFYEGPPSANGMPGIHHVMARTIKDIFCRYKTMKGFLVNRKAGWDTHGLPVELGVEKRLGITKEDIGKKITVDEYNAACRKDVMKFTKEWEDLTRKMGYWVDMNNPYITYDNRYIETLWWLLKELYNNNYLYKGYTIQPYSPAAGTGLSTHELNQPGCYRDVKDTTCVAQFKIKGEANGFFLAWTTTPWTLPSNTALCVGPNIDYVRVKAANPYSKQECEYILAESLLGAVMGKNEYEVLAKMKGSDLAGMEYEQLIPFMNPGEGAFRVITGDFVTTEDGTGIVHIAPTFGADDDRVGKANGIPPMLLIDKDGNQRPMVDLTGKFYKIEDLDPAFVAANVNAEAYGEYAGRYVKNAYDDTLTDADATLDIDLCVMLKQQGLAFKIEKHVHNYPHCWRTDKPVLYYPLDSWFIRSTAAREKMIELNNTINWKPASTGSGRFGKWLENLNDWNLSRSRYWGTPLPIWRTEDGSEEKCIGSVAELIEEIEKSIAAGFMTENPYKNFKPGVYTAENYAVENIDLHRPYVDGIILVSESGKPMKRESDLIDVWFDSGAMPFAQLHYPFENKELVESGSNYPANFISEGVDQTRGWFFTLHAISTMVKGSVAFKNVVSTGLVLDKNGNKMSKRLGNAVDPFSTIEKYGSDPLRWYMMTNASPWDNLKFDVEGIEEVRRKFFGTLYNTYSFFALYANVDGFSYTEEEVAPDQRPEIDRWILSLLNTLVKDVDEYYNTYEPTRAGRAISDFVNDHLSNWYVRLNRKRFWGGEYDTDKISAYQTLYTCLETVARLMAPISPFYADKLYNDLIKVTGTGNEVSVHLADFPTYRAELVDKTLEERMQLAQEISSMVLSLRKKENIKVRQPLSKIMLPVKDQTVRENIEAVKALILNEVNVKEINFVDNTSGILVKRIKPDFKKLGPKFGKIMKLLAVATTAMSQEDIAALEQDGKFTFTIEGQEATIELADVEVISEDIPGWLVANDGSLTVALDITITDELRKEGIAREFVNRIQNVRKSSGYEITDRIVVKIEKQAEINDAIADFSAYIATQTLANSITLHDKVEEAVDLDFEEFIVKIGVNKA